MFSTTCSCRVFKITCLPVGWYKKAQRNLFVVLKSNKGCEDTSIYIWKMCYKKVCYPTLHFSSPLMCNYIIQCMNTAQKEKTIRLIILLLLRIQFHILVVKHLQSNMKIYTTLQFSLLNSIKKVLSITLEIFKLR